MSRKHDPPDKAQLIAQFRRTPSTVELMVAAAEAQYAQKEKAGETASRATERAEKDSLAHTQARAVEPQARRRGRKPVVTAERVELICGMIATGSTEHAACIRAGIGSTAWNTAKRADATLRNRIASARDDWARLRHAQHAAALYESQSARSAGQKALKPHPTKQAKLVFWHLVKRVPLHFVAIPQAEIVAACKRFSIAIQTWTRQERAFGLMSKVYATRAAIRGRVGSIHAH